MWGNLTGWIISAFLGLGLGIMLYFVAAPPSRSDPTNSPSLAVANKEIVLPVPAESVVPFGTNDCDAGDLYRKAIEDYALTPDNYDKFQSGGQMKIRERDMSAIGYILSARDCRRGTIFGKDLAKVVNYDNAEPSLDALDKAGTICCTLGMLYMNEKYNAQLQPDKAVKLWEAAFVLGAHMYDERACWTEYRIGHGLMQTAAANLLKYYRDKNNAEKVDKIQGFMTTEGEYAAKSLEAFKIIGAIDEGYSGRYAGDVFQIALNPAADKMFRAEALKHIGHYRFNSLTRGDQLAARKVLKQMIEDDKLPPNVKAAANAAHDLTLEQHNMVGGAS